MNLDVDTQSKRELRALGDEARPFINYQFQLSIQYRSVH